MLTRISPKLNTKVTYWFKFHKKLDLNNPQTLNEKILWLKFNTYLDNPLVKQCADKYAVRKYVEEQGCSELLNELIDDFTDPDELNFEMLPTSFVVKLNIGCGFNYIVFNKADVNEHEIKAEMQRWLKEAPKNYMGYSEMQYKDVEPHFIIEKYIGDPTTSLPEDYKFYCINGKCCIIMYCSGRDIKGHGAKFYYLDTQWNMKANDKNDADVVIKRPANLENAIKYAEKLAEPFPFVRVDFYLSEDRIIFGEMTFTPSAGMDVDHKMKVLGTEENVDTVIGRLLELPTN